MSFIELGPRLLRFNIFKLLFLEYAWPIEVKFHVELSWDRGIQKYSNGPGHMTNMAVMATYGKNHKKSSLEPKSR